VGESGFARRHGRTESHTQTPRAGAHAHTHMRIVEAMRVLTFGFNLPSLARGWHGLEAGQAGNPDARDPSLTALNCHRRLGRLHHLHHHHCHYHRCHGGPLPSVHRRPPPPSPPPWQPLRTRPWTDDDGRRDGWRGKRATRPPTSAGAAMPHAHLWLLLDTLIQYVLSPSPVSFPTPCDAIVIIAVLQLGQPSSFGRRTDCGVRT